MGGVVWVNWTLNPEIFNIERKRPMDKLIVAKRQALATCEGFVDNYMSYNEPRDLLSRCKLSNLKL